MTRRGIGARASAGNASPHERNSKNRRLRAPWRFADGGAGASHRLDRLVLFPTIRLRRLLRRAAGRSGTWTLAPGAGGGDAPQRTPLPAPDADSGDDPQDS